MLRTVDCELYPIKMAPAFKDYIWGGDRLIKEWGKDCPFDIAAESWELSGHKNGLSIAKNGSLKGLNLNEIVEKWGTACLGDKSKGSDRFPILIKLIDSKQRLSIQVHPDDEYAMRVEGDSGKTEMWYIAQASEGSGILCGFKKDISKDEYKKRIADNTLTDVLNFIPVKKGDVFFISPGTVHAICEGTIIAEIQQSSDITYRVYDYGRVSAEGKPRELHIQKALDVSRLKGEKFSGKPLSKPQLQDGYTKTLLAQCKYFTVYELNIADRCKLKATRETFNAITFMNGQGEISFDGKTESFKKGDTFFVPADMGEYEIRGKSEVLLTLQ
jgi:mannose-6-phosphate isomerase